MFDLCQYGHIYERFTVIRAYNAIKQADDEREKSKEAE